MGKRLVMPCFPNQPLTADFWTCNWPLLRKKNRTSNFKINSEIVIVLLQLMSELHFIWIFFGSQFQLFQPIIYQSFAFQPVAKQHVTKCVLYSCQPHSGKQEKEWGRGGARSPMLLFRAHYQQPHFLPEVVELLLPPNSTTCWKPTATSRVDQEGCVSISWIQLSKSALIC